MEALNEGLEPLGRIRRLELGQPRQELLRPAHLVHRAQLMEVLVVLLDLELGDDLQHVPGDPFLRRETIDRDGRRLGRGPFEQAADDGPSVGSGVFQLGGVSIVAIEARKGRARLKDAFPESVGDGLDGRGGIRHRGHGRSPGLRASVPAARGLV